MKTYAKSDLVAGLALEHEMTQAEARRILDSALLLITTAANAGLTVQLTGFGSFRQVERAAGTARNPRTGEAVPVAARSTLKFRASQPKAGA